MFCRILQHLAASAPKELSKAGACSVLKAHHGLSIVYEYFINSDLGYVYIGTRTAKM